MVELLVTLAITVFGFAALLASNKVLSGGTASAGRAQEASTIGVQTLESLRARRVQDLTTELTGSPISTPPFSRPSYATVAGRNGVTYTVDVDVAEVSSTLWRLRTTVGWTDDDTGAPRALPLELVRSIREEL